MVKNKVNTEKIKKKIEEMRNRPCACRVIYGSVKCAYRAFTQSELNQHEKNHTKAIESKKNSSARMFEVPLVQCDYDSECDSELRIFG